MKGREAIESFYKKYNFKPYDVVCMEIIAKLKDKPIFIGNCNIVVKENYRTGSLEIDCLDDSFQAKKIGSSWNTKKHDIAFDNGKLIIIDKVKEVKIIIGN